MGATNARTMRYIKEVNAIQAWHFVRDNGKLFGGEPVMPSVTYRSQYKPDEYKKGLHASIDPLDAAMYAPGSQLCRVEMFGAVLEMPTKVSASHRRVLWMADAAPMMCWLAWRIANYVFGNQDSPVGLAALNARKEYLTRFHEAELESEKMERAWADVWYESIAVGNDPALHMVAAACRPEPAHKLLRKTIRFAQLAGWNPSEKRPDVNEAFMSLAPKEACKS